MAREFFLKVRREFSRYCMPFAGKMITYVEIGCWLGGSAQWVANNVLTHPHSRGYGIDPYLPMGRHTAAIMADIQAQARHRISLSPAATRWQWIVDRSQNVLKTWPHGKIDLLYIDGAHNAHDCLMDFVLAWPHLTTGSVVIFDDYGIGLRKRLKSNIPEVPDAVESIMRSFGVLVKAIMGPGHQFALEVTKHVEAGAGVAPREVRDAIREGRGILPPEPPKPGTEAWRRAGRAARRKRLKGLK